MRQETPNRHLAGDYKEYFSVKDEFVQNSPEQLLYIAIYQVKKSLRMRFPDENPYWKRNEDGDYILLTAISNLAFLLASVEVNNPFSAILDEIEGDEVNIGTRGPTFDAETEARITEKIKSALAGTAQALEPIEVEESHNSFNSRTDKEEQS